MVRPLVPLILFPIVHGDNQFVGRLLPRIYIYQGITVCGKLLQNLRYFKAFFRGIRRFPLFMPFAAPQCSLQYESERSPHSNSSPYGSPWKYGLPEKLPLPSLTITNELRPRPRFFLPRPRAVIEGENPTDQPLRDRSFSTQSVSVAASPINGPQSSLHAKATKPPRKGDAHFDPITLTLTLSRLLVLVYYGINLLFIEFYFWQESQVLDSPIPHGVGYILSMRVGSSHAFRRGCLLVISVLVNGPKSSFVKSVLVTGFFSPAQGHNLSSWYALLPSTEMPGLSPRWGKHLDPLFLRFKQLIALLLLPYPSATGSTNSMSFLPSNKPKARSVHLLVGLVIGQVRSNSRYWKFFVLSASLRVFRVPMGSISPPPPSLLPVA
ncbi:hypothetical protein VNO77_47148 [Canavalia gladiata]|uniref:Uncharacterized protein n=1 Tax=Canavalia gladiata TaxID=3824 RepID=A0AAN9PH30_CANGL